MSDEKPKMTIKQDCISISTSGAIKYVDENDGLEIKYVNGELVMSGSDYPSETALNAAIDDIKATVDDINEFNEIIQDSDMIECSSCEILQSTINFHLKPYMTAGGRFVCSDCFLGNVEKTL